MYLYQTKSRIAYSDQKIYNADIEGFDTFRALNFYDLDETLGAITKLITVGDNVFCIQEAAYSYIPVDAQIIETADAVDLSIRSGEVIGIPNYINTNNGSQHIKTIQQTGNGFYFFDYKNKVLINNTGGKEQIVSDSGMLDRFNDIAHTAWTKYGHQPSDLVGIYDSKNRQYILAKRRVDDDIQTDSLEFTYLYDEKLGVWTNRLCEEGATSVSLFGGVTGKYGDLYLIGTEKGVTNAVSISTMYTGSLGTFFGVSQPAYIKYVVNSIPDLPKTFDSIIVNANAEVTDIDISVPLNDGISYSTNIATFSDVESLYKAKTLRNTTSIGGKTGQRMRGLYAYCTINFDQTKETTLNSVLTRFRPSNRGI
jgi:hypothetical protein